MNTDIIRRTFELAEYCASIYGSKPAFFQKKANRWNPLTCIEYRDNSRLLALGLLDLGIKKGENIATIFNNNCPQWNLLDMALSQIGAVHIPVYPTISDSDYLFILNQAGVRFVFVSDQFVFNKVSVLQIEIPTIEKIISAGKLPNIENIDDLINLGEKSDSNTQTLLEERKKSILPGDVVTIIYTSGTTGFPKGAMLSHTNMVSSMFAAANRQPLGIGKRVLSFLPLCHVYERTANYQFQLKGAEIYYCENLKSMMNNLIRVKPHGITVVPRVLEKIIKMVIVRNRNRNFIIRFVVKWAVRFGYQYKPYQKRGRLYNLWHKLAYIMVFSKVKASMGGRISYIGCGGAPLNDKVTRFFWAAKMPVYEGYGLSECSPLVAVNSPGKGNYWIGSVGPVAQDVEVKITDEGEILCKGPNIMKGYYKQRILTSETIIDGWLYTGDIGQFIRGKYLQITGRKKPMFKTSYGKYIVPQAIENKFTGSLCIGHIVVIGEGKHCAAAIISPNFDYIRQNFPDTQKLSNAKLIVHGDVKKMIKREVDKVNNTLGKTEQLSMHLIVADNWSPETGELSPTHKIKRNIILKKYKRQINALYQDESL